MKQFELVSDLHLDFYGDDVLNIIRSWEPKTNTLVIAGDLCELRNLRTEWMDALHDMWTNVVYVPGNHDYYGASLHPNTLEEIRQYCHVLTRQTVKLDGIKFAGATMWFPHNHPMPIREEQYMSDFGAIGAYAGVPFREDVDTHHEKDWQFFAWAHADVWVMHHMPFAQSISPKYAGNHLNRFFYAQCEDLYEACERAPRIIVHGHTHEQCDYKYASTRVVCNPRGYPNERYGPYAPQLIEF